MVQNRRDETEQHQSGTVRNVYMWMQQKYDLFKKSYFNASYRRCMPRMLAWRRAGLDHACQSDNMAKDGEIIQRQHFCHYGVTICHPKSGYVTTKLHGTSTVDAIIIRYFQTELFSRFPPSSYAGHINLTTAKHWQFMPK